MRATGVVGFLVEGFCGDCCYMEMQVRGENKREGDLDGRWFAEFYSPSIHLIQAKN